MNKHRKLLSLTMLTALAIFTLVGCGSNNADTTTGSSATDTSASSENAKAAKETSLTIGRITAIDGDRVALECYTSEEKIFAATDIDPDTLSATGETATVTLEEDARVETVDNGVIKTSTTDALTVDDLIAVSDEKGQTIYILGRAAGNTTANTNNTTTGNTEATGTGDNESTDTDDTTANENADSVSPTPDGSTTESTGGNDTTTGSGTDGSNTGDSGAVTYPETNTDSTNENTATVQ